MAELTPTDIEKVAELARLEFSADEITAFTAQLGSIVQFIEQLNQVDTAGVEVMTHPLDIHSVTRADDRASGLTRDQALQNSPSHDEECFRVPAVLAK